MEARIIGDGNFTFNLVVKTMQKSSVFENCRKKWRDLAFQLNTKTETTTEIQGKINRGESYGTSAILLDLLTEWRARVHKDATLEAFTEALNKVDLHDISVILMKALNASLDNIDDGVDSTSVNKEDARPITEEGKKLREYLQYYIIDLIEITELNEELLQEMVEKGVLDGKDIENINRSRFLDDKVKRFYHIVLEKIGKEPEIYANILSVFMADEPNRENGVADILERYFD